MHGDDRHNGKPSGFGKGPGRGSDRKGRYSDRGEGRGFEGRSGGRDRGYARPSSDGRFGGYGRDRDRDGDGREPRRDSDRPRRFDDEGGMGGGRPERGRGRGGEGFSRDRGGFGRKDRFEGRGDRFEGGRDSQARRGYGRFADKDEGSFGRRGGERRSGFGRGSDRGFDRGSDRRFDRGSDRGFDRGRDRFGDRPRGRFESEGRFGGSGERGFRSRDGGRFEDSRESRFGRDDRARGFREGRRDDRFDAGRRDGGRYGRERRSFGDWVGDERGGFGSDRYELGGRGERNSYDERPKGHALMRERKRRMEEEFGRDRRRGRGAEGRGFGGGRGSDGSGFDSRRERPARRDDRFGKPRKNRFEAEEELDVFAQAGLAGAGFAPQGTDAMEFGANDPSAFDAQRELKPLAGIAQGGADADELEEGAVEEEAENGRSGPFEDGGADGADDAVGDDGPDDSSEEEGRGEDAEEGDDEEGDDEEDGDEEDGDEEGGDVGESAGSEPAVRRARKGPLGKAKKMSLRKSNKKIESQNDKLRAKRVAPERIEPQRLQKILAGSGYGSRRDMEALIEQGRVKLNGEVAVLGSRASFGDEVTIDDRRCNLKWPDRLPRIVLYHKMEGEIVTRDDPEGRVSVYDRVPAFADKRWLSIGRLDFNTSGLLIFTTSGDLANRFSHPSSQVDREYMARVSEEIDPEDLARLETEGIELDDGLAKVELIEKTGSTDNNVWYRVIVREGRYREVRRIFEALGKRVSKLMRVRFGPVAIPPRLKPGFYYELNPVEVDWVLTRMGMPMFAKP